MTGTLTAADRRPKRGGDASQLPLADGQPASEYRVSSPLPQVSDTTRNKLPPTSLALVNMPFSSLKTPSLALTQLLSTVQRSLGPSADVEVVYANHAFARRFGRDFAESVAVDGGHQSAGLGEWMFRFCAFPDHAGSPDSYLERFYPGTRFASFRSQVRQLLDEIPSYISDLVDEFDLANYEIVGFTTMFAQTVPSIAAARAVKARNPDAITIIGGANCEAPMGATLVSTVDALDYAFSGRAEVTLPKFLQAITTREGESVCDSIPGIVSARNASIPEFRDALGEERPLGLDSPPEFNHFIKEFDKTFPPGVADTEPVLFFETSRGCWWGEKSHCTFCGLNGETMAFRSTSSHIAVKQIQDIIDRYYPWCRSFSSVDNIMPKEYPDDVFPHLEVPSDASIFYEVKSSLKREDLAAMAKARVMEVQPGIESLATSTLKLMGKGASSLTNVRFLLDCLATGVSPVWNLLIGFPGETADVYERYIRILPTLHHLPPPVGVFSVRFDRYSPYFTRSSDWGLKLRPLDYYAFAFPLPEDAIRRIAYYFADDSGQEYIEAYRAWMPDLRVAVQDWQAKWRDERRRPRLELHRTTGLGASVIDSRSGKLAERELSCLHASILDFAQGATSVARLQDEVARDLPDVKPNSTRKAISDLQEYGLLFEDEGRCISLLEVDRPHGDCGADASASKAVDARPPMMLAADK